MQIKINIPAAAHQIVLHSIIVNGVEGAAVFQKSLLDTVHMDADDQTHLGFDIYERKHLRSESKQILLPRLVQSVGGFL